jgi:L-ascorbate metabolism protein UlaG (beta-lactamase superfamily)
MKIGKVEIDWLGHSGILIKDSKIIYIDPYAIKDNSEKADFILITHSHYDHCSIEDMQKIVQPGTKIILPPDCQSKVTRFSVPVQIEIFQPDQEKSFGAIKISSFPAYNVDKSFHPKSEGWLGYLIKTDGVLIYHAGDTDIIPEMKNLTGYGQSKKDFVAFLPIGGRFTMNAEEAAEAAKIIKPSLAIPIHYGSIVGNHEDAKEFSELCRDYGIRVSILEKI